MVRKLLWLVVPALIGWAATWARSTETLPPLSAPKQPARDSVEERTPPEVLPPLKPEAPAQPEQLTPLTPRLDLPQPLNAFPIQVKPAQPQVIPQQPLPATSAPIKIPGKLPPSVAGPQGPWEIVRPLPSTPNEMALRVEAAPVGATLCCHEPIRALFTVGHDWGEGVGFDSGFTYAEGFIPFAQSPGLSLAFADVRVVNFDDVDLNEWNVGGGVRWVNRMGTHVLGLNAFYDGRQTSFDDYHQVGLGFEAMGEFLDFRVNSYTVLGRNATPGPVPFAPPAEVALSGAEAELGGRIPVLIRHDPRVYVGFYHFSSDATETANGVRLRAQARVTDWLSIHASVQNDSRFDTTVYGGLALHFGQPRPTYRARVEDKLGEPVGRTGNVVIGR